MRESSESPEYESKSHPPSFLKKAARMATAKKSEHDGKKAPRKAARKHASH